jgi:CheY-like chemotaxis protein/predicted regulator of Ras-like GTPase activity (Roadblock/LC7/MglB family)
MKNVLIVDRDNSFSTDLKQGLLNYKEHFHTLMASSGKGAIRILETTPVHLVVTELTMPDMDGFDLLNYINRNFPAVPSIVMTSPDTPNLENDLKDLDAIMVLRKPLDPEQVAQAIMKGLKNFTVEGFLKDISLTNFLQVLETSQKTCLVQIDAGENRNGLFYFFKGVLHDAVCGDLKGKEAALEMIEWADVEIRFRTLPKKRVKRRIETGLMPLIMEAMRLRDQAQQDITAEQTVSQGNETLQTINEEMKGVTNMELQEMSELELLRYVTENTPGAIAAGLVGMDGISLGVYNTVPEFDTTVADAEFAGMLKLGKKAAANLKVTGELDELMFIGTEGIVIVRMIGDDYYTGIALKPDGNIGMARLVQKRVVPILFKRFYG